MPTLQEAFDTAAAMRGSGQIAPAENILRQILAQFPEHAPSASLLGIILTQSARSQEGLQWMSRAAAIEPTNAEFQNNLGIINLTIGNGAPAESAFRKAIALKPDSPDAYTNLGNVLKMTGRLDESIAAYRKSLAIAPEDAHALSNLGQALTQKKQLSEAIDACRRALSARPNFPEAHHNLADALLADGQISLAIEHCNIALTLRPDMAQVYSTLGNALAADDRLDEAIIAYRRAIALSPGYAEAHNNLGSALKRQKKLPEAAEALKSASRLDPSMAAAHANLGNTLKEMGKAFEAMEHYERARGLEPKQYESLVGLASALAEIGQYDRSIDLYRKALDVRPDSGVAHWNLSHLLLMRGDYTNGWREFEWRFKAPRELPLRPREYSVPQWAGEKVAGKTILIYAEQGFGDTIQFARYLPEVARRGGQIVLQVQLDLIHLLQTLDGLERIIPMEEPPGQFDFHLPMLSLPNVLNIEIPASIPYLKADAEKIKRFSDFIPRDQRLKVGLAWAGSILHANDKNRSIALERFARLFENENVQFISLQKGNGLEQIKSAPIPLLDLSDKIFDLADTAALIENLDLVICVDTSIAHLAGAMGKEVWVLIPQVADWRWLLNRTDSPWYPTMTLYRQPMQGDWREPIERVAEALRKRRFYT